MDGDGSSRPDRPNGGEGRNGISVMSRWSIRHMARVVVDSPPPTKSTQVQAVSLVLCCAGWLPVSEARYCPIPSHSSSSTAPLSFFFPFYFPLAIHRRVCSHRITHFPPSTAVQKRHRSNKSSSLHPLPSSNEISGLARAQYQASCYCSLPPSSLIHPPTA
jgi:hypothetical protein